MSSHTRTGTARRHGWGARGSGGLVARARALALSALLVLSQVLGLFGSALGPEAAYASSPQTQTSSLTDLHNPNGSRYLSDVVGVTREQVVAELEAHEHDSYYLGTPYVGLQSVSLGGTGGKPHPNGSGLSPVGMQCGGFVAYVLAAAGGDPYGTLAYGPYGWWSLKGWHHLAVAKDVVCYTFDSKEELLASGLAQKGDIIVAYATDPVIAAGRDQYGNAMDAHTGFFWGDTPSEDLMWQSIHPSNGFGTVVSGNQISPIQGKVYPCVYALYPMGPTKRLYDPMNFVVQKVDSQGAQVSDWDAQGNATTVGTQFTIKFYEGVTADSVDQLPSSPTRTWVIQTKDLNGYVRARLSDECKVSGDDWYYDDNGKISLPLGSFTVQETKAPEGYVMSDSSVHLGQVKAGDDGYATIEPIGNWTRMFDQEDAGAGLAVADDVVRGGAKFAKVDAERDAAVPQGDATLAGAEITITNASASAVEVNGTWYQPGEDVLTLTTGEDGTAQSATDALPYGSYTARETKASEGYLLNSDWSKTFSVTDQGALVDCTDAPLGEQVVRGGASFAKVDAERDFSVPQGDATLAGAEITITNASAHAVEVGGTTYQPGEDVLTVTTGEDGTAQTAADALPYGSYTARETKASRGYLLNTNWSRSFQVTEDGQMVDCTATPLPEDVVRGGAKFAKVDAERDEAVPEGSATLAGAAITIRNDSARSVLVGGTWYQPGEDVLTVTTGEDGIAQTAADALPYGTYTARETSPSRGYLLNSDWSKTFTVSDEGVVVDCTDSPLEEQAIRGDLSAVKADEDSMERMAGVPFLVTSETTGEWHVVVTDENGMLDTSSSWNPHTQRTNANDAAYDPATGTVDDSKLDSTAGLWFSGSADGATPVDDSLGALPYDTYTVRELRSAANEGHNLAAFTVTVTRNGVNLDMGTVDDSTVAIGTTLTDADGAKSVPEAASARLVDEVAYQGLTPGAEYTLEGELHVVNDDGTDGGVVATASTDFKAGTKVGTAEQAFDVDTTQLGGRSLVAFETVRDSSGATVATHADLADEGQTVVVPSIHTTLQGDAGHESAATQHVTLTDKVVYSGLEAGKTYTATGTLHYVLADGTDGGAVRDADGDEVTASASFRAESSDGSVDVTFDFDAPDLAGKTVVAFEDVSHNGVTYATHADVTDEGQTVRFPSVHTTATADATGDHELPAASGQKVTDTVHVENLTAGHEYVVTGTLHIVNDGTDGGALTDADGDDVTATTTFTAEAATQDVEVPFDVDASALAGRSVVAFEDLSTGGVCVATHADIADEGQTLRVPAIHTTATDQAGMHEHQVTDADSRMELTDTVSYEGLTPGTEYVATGTLHLVNPDGTDGGALKDADGDDVTASTTFTPDAADGTVDVEFAFDASQLAGKTVVAFEDVSRSGVTVATHADVTDEGQSVHFVDIHTTATDKADGDHQIAATQTQTVVDRVEYTNLVPGKEYTITGTLHLVNPDGTDAGVLSDASGNKVTVTKMFTPDTPDGYVDVEFTFDATGLAGRRVVAFEDLSTAGTTIATHADITDEGQTVTVETPETGGPQGGSSSYPNTGQGPVAATLIAAGLTAVCAAGIRAARRRRKAATDEPEAK
ncbi:MAG: VaFE repeat-containing surface-anchored protein [Coriobacteriaceae bacterium]|nr:VaFE repeat-containing surface-anchored protein [Coriobacteriaceae bacterium]MDD7584538.1 VaFE repeat-containing surface-anchored protein [Coriobacteriaceae bacterium]